jgi:hypothetical protein
MPQLDYFIIASQLNMLILFIVGFLLFKYYLLPLISFFLKVDSKLIIKKYKDIYNVGSYMETHKDLYEINSILLNGLSTICQMYIDHKQTRYIIFEVLEEGVSCNLDKSLSDINFNY